MFSNLTIRAMHPDDLPFAAECTVNVGWARASESLVSFESFYQYDPQGCLIALLGDTPVGICIATLYGLSGFIGELIVSAEARGKGIGAALLQYGVSYLHDHGARTVYLDGVVPAIPLYERNGFRKICRSLRFSGRMEGGEHPSVRPMQQADLPAVYRLDQEAFGANRGYYIKRRLELFPHFCKVMVEDGQLTGFITANGRDDLVSVGPWIVKDNSNEALWLLKSVVREVGDVPINLSILENNQKAVERMYGLGFTIRKDCPWRMALGPDENLGMSNQCQAIGSPAKG
jgi:ribosomal protein S18 acetylase RimI-like enzyme